MISDVRVRRFAIGSAKSEAPSLVLPNSAVKDVRGATHVLTYALRTAKLINIRRLHCERELIFVIENFSVYEIIALYDNKLVKGSERGQQIGKLFG